MFGEKYTPLLCVRIIWRVFSDVRCKSVELKSCCCYPNSNFMSGKEGGGGGGGGAVGRS